MTYGNEETSKLRVIEESKENATKSKYYQCSLSMITTYMIMIG